MLENFIDNFNLKNKSIMSDFFYGVTRSIMKCSGCGVTKYSFQTFNLQIFQLKKIKEDKLKDIGQQYFIGLDLYDAFYYQQKEEILLGENMIYCNGCKQLQNGIHQQSIYELPYVLIIILNRGKDNQDYNEDFRFYDILDFTTQPNIF